MKKGENKVLYALFGTPQGRVASIGYALLLTVLILSIIHNNTKQEPQYKLSGAEIFVIFLLLAAAYTISIYSISCMVLGAGAGVGCGIWAWANSIVVVIFAIAILLSALFQK